MKKAVSFIFSLLMIFLPFLGRAYAAHGKETPDMISKNCKEWLQEAKKMVSSKPEKNLTESSKIWAEHVITLSKKIGLDCHPYQLNFHNTDPYWVVFVNQGETVLVCDYYKTIYELLQKKLPLPKDPWPLMTFSEYMKVKVMDEGKSLNLIWSPDAPTYQAL